MAELRFTAMPSDAVRALQAGGRDANGQSPECKVSDGSGIPCRHCLVDVAAGEPFLILAWRPFPVAQPYAEVGPVFLHAEACARYADGGEIPPILLSRDRFLIRGYGDDDRIAEGSGQIVATADLTRVAAALLGNPEIAYIHARSATNNCYQCRIDKV